MKDDRIRWQMRKIGYDAKGCEGIAFADRQYQFLEWLQDLYNHNCLKGDFHTDNIIQELWDEIRRFPNPLQKMEEGYIQMYEQFEMIISGDSWLEAAQKGEWTINGQS